MSQRIAISIKLLIEDYLAANEQYQLETSEDERRPFNPHSAPSTVTLKILSKSSKRLPDLNYRLICWISRFTISPKNLIGFFGFCYAMDGGYKGWNPYIERHLAIFVNYF